MMNPNVPNRTLFHGDNLDFLQNLNSESVDLIATDPPFNAQRVFAGVGQMKGSDFKDNWSWDEAVHPDW